MKSKLLQIVHDIQNAGTEHAASPAHFHLKKAQEAMEVFYQANATAELESNEVTVSLLRLLAQEKEQVAASAVRLGVAEEKLNQAKAKLCVMEAVVELDAILRTELQAEGISPVAEAEINSDIFELMTISENCEGYASIEPLTRILRAALQRAA